MMLTPEQLAEIKARADKATPGPWWSWTATQQTASQPPSHGSVQGPPRVAVDKSSLFLPEDAEFIGAARQDVPALLAHIDAQAERIAELERHTPNARFSRGHSHTHCSKQGCQNSAVVEGYLGSLIVWACEVHEGEVEQVRKDYRGAQP